MGRGSETLRLLPLTIPPAIMSSEVCIPMLISLSLLVLIIGLVMYTATKTNGEIKEVGRIMFFAGLLAFLLNLDRIVALFPGGPR